MGALVLLVLVLSTGDSVAESPPPLSLQSSMGDTADIALHFDVIPADIHHYLPGLDHHIMSSLPTVLVEDMPVSLLERIVPGLPGLVSVEYLQELTPVLDISTRTIRADPGSLSGTNGTLGPGQHVYDGKGVVVAILDSGIGDHPDLKPAQIAGADFTNDDLDPGKNGSFDPWPDGDHATMVAGIVAGNGDEYTGVAPGVSLLDIKILDGFSSILPAVRAVDWCIDNKDTDWEGAPVGVRGIQVMSMSVSGLSGSDGSDLLSRAVNRAVEAGIVVVIAAGNDGPDNGGIPSPAAADLAISVGSMDDRNTLNRADDRMSDFSNRGPRADDGDGTSIDEMKPNLVAPGTNIMSTSLDRYDHASGTSVACPHVSGVVAMMLQANPRLSPQDVSIILNETASDMNGGRKDSWDPDTGWGVVDARDAIASARKGYIRIVVDSPMLALNGGDGVHFSANVVETTAEGIDEEPEMRLVIIMEDGTRFEQQINGTLDMDLRMPPGRYTYRIDATLGNRTTSTGDLTFVHDPPPPLAIHFIRPMDPMLSLEEEREIAWEYVSPIVKRLTPETMVSKIPDIRLRSDSTEYGLIPISGSIRCDLMSGPDRYQCTGKFIFPDDLDRDQVTRAGFNHLMAYSDAPVYDIPFLDMTPKESDRETVTVRMGPYIVYWSPVEKLDSLEVDVRLLSWKDDAPIPTIQMLNRTGDVIFTRTLLTQMEPVPISDQVSDTVATEYDLERGLGLWTYPLTLPYTEGRFNLRVYAEDSFGRTTVSSPALTFMPSLDPDGPVEVEVAPRPIPEPPVEIPTPLPVDEGPGITVEEGGQNVPALDGIWVLVVIALVVCIRHRP